MPSGGGTRFLVEERESFAVTSESVRVVRRAGSVAGAAMPEFGESRWISGEVFNLRRYNPRINFTRPLNGAAFSEPAGWALYLYVIFRYSVHTYTRKSETLIIFSQQTTAIATFSKISQYDVQSYQNNYDPRTLRRKSLLIGIDDEGTDIGYARDNTYSPFLSSHLQKGDIDGVHALSPCSGHDTTITHILFPIRIMQYYPDSDWVLSLPCTLIHATPFHLISSHNQNLRLVRGTLP